MSFYNKLFFSLMIIFLSNCTGNSNAVVKNMAAEEETLEILKALRSKDGIFSNSSRNMKSSVEHSVDFDQNFPGTNVSCGYILRYFFIRISI